MACVLTGSSSLNSFLKKHSVDSSGISMHSLLATGQTSAMLTALWMIPHSSPFCHSVRDIETFRPTQPDCSTVYFPKQLGILTENLNLRVELHTHIYT